MQPFLFHHELNVMEVITAGLSRMWLGTGTGLGGSISSVGSFGLSSTGSTFDDRLTGQIFVRGLFSFLCVLHFLINWNLDFFEFIQTS